MTRELLSEARRALGIEHLVLGIHDASFPCRADEDLARGTPYGRGARDLLEWALDRGFTGVQLGPQGETSKSNPSPYDGASFAKTLLSAAVWPLAHDPAWEGILSRASLERLVWTGATDRMQYARAWSAAHDALAEAYARVGRDGPLFAQFRAWASTAEAWLDRDARYDALARRHGTDDWRAWPADDAPPNQAYAFAQFVVHRQHADFLAWADGAGLRVFGDLQIGVSHRDLWRREHLYLRDWLMGAPPSRTNPEGQPWAYPVAVPGDRQALAILEARARKLLGELHGLRIDHPHGHVCPWVYRAGTNDPVQAVKAGARLFASPDDPDLARFAIARADQIDRSIPAYAEHRVTQLDEAQVDVYATNVEALVGAARALGRAPDDVLFEVLSTCPYPLARVMQRYGAGRFRVTQKADPSDAADVYSTHQAQRGDWVMLGNHDTPPIWRVLHGWSDARTMAWCDHLAARLGEGAVDRDAIAHDRARLAQPMLADLFACDAGRVSVFFADLFGYHEVYNTPGVVKPDNWTLRLERGFRATHDERVARGHALDVPAALAIALRARGHVSLAERLERAR